MPTIISHSLSAGILSGFLAPKNYKTRLILLSAISSVIPDLDVIGFYFNVPYSSFWGHRGVTHSIAFALIAAIAIRYCFFRKLRWSSIQGFYILFILFFATLSHSLFDAMTDGGLGVALYSPFDNTRYFFECCQLIPVSPIGIMDFLPGTGPSKRVLMVFGGEFYYILMPSILIGLLIHFSKN